jgi:DNA-binding beta-propeller fold protein YncE
MRFLWASRRNLLAAVLGATLLALPVPAEAGPGSGASPEGDDAACTAVPGVNDRCPTWVSTYDNPNGHNGDDAATAMAVSPDGTRAFVTGQSWDNDTGSHVGCCPPPGGYDVATAAYDPATGNRLWAARYEGSADSWDVPIAIAVSSDGSTVFVGAIVNQEWVPDAQGLTTITSEFGLMAYDAVTGDELWTSSYSVPDSDLQVSWPSAMAVSADGRRVYMTGYSRTYEPVAGPFDVTIVAFDAGNGDQVWASREFAGGGVSVGVSPSGDRVYVTGFVQTPTSLGTYLTIAYEAADPDRLGEAVWTASHGDGSTTGNFGRFLRVSPDGSRVYVTGEYNQVNGGNGHSEFGTVAYDAGTGAQVWAASYSGPTPGFHYPTGFEVSPAGDRVFVTGYGLNFALSKYEYATAAYDTSTGVQVWAKEYTAPGTTYDVPYGVAASPDGRHVYVTGISKVQVFGTAADVTTVAYDAGSGNQEWASPYSSALGHFDYGAAVTVAPSGAVLVAGAFQVRGVAVAGVPLGGSGDPGDFALLRYDA